MSTPEENSNNTTTVANGSSPVTIHPVDPQSTAVTKDTTVTVVTPTGTDDTQTQSQPAFDQAPPPPAPVNVADLFSQAANWSIQVESDAAGPSRVTFTRK